MKLKNYATLFLTATFLSFYSCDDQNNIEGGGRVYATMAITPALEADGNYGNGEDNAKLWITGTQFVLSNLNNLALLQTDEIAVTKGQNVNMVTMLETSQSLSCRNVTIKLYHNNNIVKTETYNMGYNGNTYTFCSEGGSNQFNWIVP
jgi:hypothetical protein